jgi:uncharacterized repeat protein (TIGR01451 family)
VVAAVVAALLVGMLAVSSPVEAAVIRPFTTRFSINTTGAIVMTGNTLLTCPATASGCLGARVGSGTATATNNNSYTMQFVDIDGDPATFNSSRNTLSIPATSTVAFAGLYWGADTTAGTGGSGALAPASRGQVLFRTPDTGAYQVVVASRVDTSSGGVRYQGFADVTDLVTAGRSGEYTIANVQAGRGADRYGGWALVVAYQDPNEPVRNLTIFDGYAVVQQSPVGDQNVAVPVSGFLTPPTGQVRSRVGVVAYEGDLGLTGDSLRLNTTQLTNSLNPATNFFNSSLTGFNTTNTTGDPFQTNLFGFDIDTINANGVLANSATSATINLNTNSDTYFPGVVSFSTELFAPRLDVAKSGVDLNGGTLDTGDEVLYTMRVVNNGEDSAAGVVLADIVPDSTTYVPGSLRVDGVAVTDAADADAAELAAPPTRIVARLGAGAGATSGGTIATGASHTVSFRVTVGEVPVDEPVTNTATVAYRGATSGLPVEAMSNTVVLAARPRSDLGLLKIGPALPVTVPGSIDYTLTAVNRGPASEPAAVVTDTLPPGFIATGATSTRGTCVLGTGTVTCDLGALTVGATATMQLSGTVVSGSGTITNTARVDGANLDLLPNNNAASAVVALNNPPTVVGVSASTANATAVDIDVLGGAADIDGDTVAVVSAGPATTGSVVVTPSGTVTYIPDPTFAGIETFAFTVSDGKGGYASALITVTVANAPPIANDDGAATPPDTSIDVDVVANDSDPNGDSLAVVSVRQPVGAGIGVASVNPDGTVRFVPDAGFVGTAVFTYTISDGVDTATATVRISVPDVAPVAVDDDAVTPSGTAVDIDVLANDLDDNGQPLVVDSVSQPVGGATVGIASITIDGTVRFVPNASFRGIATFTYAMSDGANPATATVRVVVLNAPPDALDDEASTASATPVDLDVLANDRDANGDALSVIGVAPPTNGSVVVGPGGVLTYTPNVGFKGIDTFAYIVTDGTDTATAIARVDVANSPPLGGADRRTTRAGTAITIDVLGNDFDPNGDALSVVGLFVAPSHGTAAVNPDGTVGYVPNAGFKGLDTFVYSVSDGTDSATATVTVTVLDGPPVAFDDTATTPMSTATTISVLGNDEDPNDDLLEVVATSTPARGSVVINPDGTITYTPDPGFVGVDSFDYTITDGTETSTATVTITVVAGAPTTTAPSGTSTTTSVPPDPVPSTTAGGDPARPRGPLSHTGAEIATFGFAALVLLGGGAVLVFVARRSAAVR